MALKTWELLPSVLPCGRITTALHSQVTARACRVLRFHDSAAPALAPS